MGPLIRVADRRRIRLILDHHDMTDNKLCQHIAEMLDALSERLPTDQRLKERTATLNKPARGDIDAHRHHALEYEAIAEETLDPVYQRIASQGEAILMITTDDSLIKPVSKLIELTGGELDDHKRLVHQNKTAQKDLTFFLSAAGTAAGAIVRAVLRKKQLDQATAELERYYGQHCSRA